MSDSGKKGNVVSISGRRADGTFDYGHTFGKPKLPYEYKLIRDAIKSAVHAAAAGLAMTQEDAKDYYSRPNGTVLEAMFADALENKRWDVLERFFDRIIGKADIQIHQTVEHRTLLDDLTEEQTKKAIQAAQLSLGKNES